MIPPKHETPIFCSAGVGRGGLEPEVAVIAVSLDKPHKLAGLTQRPVYTLYPVPEKYSQNSANLTFNKNTGVIYSTSIGYQYEDEEIGFTTGILITTHYDVYLPFPIWEPDEFDNIIAPMELVNFLPQDGVKVYSADGIIFHWIEEEALYSIYVEGSLFGQLPEDIVNLLNKAGGE